MSEKLCDRDCNNCPFMRHHNSRMITRILNELLVSLGNEVNGIVQRNCPNLSVCYDCCIDNFCHDEGCDLAGGDPPVKKGSPAQWTKDPPKEEGWYWVRSLSHPKDKPWPEEFLHNWTNFGGVEWWPVRITEPPEEK